MLWIKREKERRVFADQWQWRLKIFWIRSQNYTYILCQISLMKKMLNAEATAGCCCEWGLENRAGHLNGGVTSEQLRAWEGAKGHAVCPELLKIARTSNPDPAINYQVEGGTEGMKSRCGCSQGRGKEQSGTYQFDPCSVWAVTADLVREKLKVWDKWIEAGT